MMCTAELDTANSVEHSSNSDFLTNAAWTIHSTYHTVVLKASPGAASFGWDMLVDIPFLADWNKIGECRQHRTDLDTACENCSCRDWDYQVGDKVLLQKDGILANQRVGMNVILGISHQFIQMGQSGFNVEQSQND